jgi:hypothetical protein
MKERRMILVKKSFMIFILLFSLVGCTRSLTSTIPLPSPTFTPYVEGTQTAQAGPSATPTPLFSTFPTAILPTDTPASLESTPLPTTSGEKPTDFSPVLYGGKFNQATSFLLLGGVSKDGWLSPEESVARFAGEVTYSLNTMDIANKYFLWGKTPEFFPTCKAYAVRSDADPGENGLVAVLDGWRVTKYPVTELSSTQDQIYHQAVLDWLKGQGVANPQSGVVHIFKVDLENDGVDEVFLSATHLDESQHTTKTGDYSVILMRKLVGNDVTTTLVVGDLYNSQVEEITYPNTYSLANFIDLNQDGVLEIVVDVKKWEKFGAIIYQVDSQNVQEVLRTIC